MNRWRSLRKFLTPFLKFELVVNGTITLPVQRRFASAVTLVEEKPMRHEIKNKIIRNEIKFEKPYMTSEETVTFNSFFSLITFAWDSSCKTAFFFFSFENKVKSCDINDSLSVKNLLLWIIDTRVAIINDIERKNKFYQNKEEKKAVPKLNEIYTIIYSANPIVTNSNIDKSILIKELKKMENIIISKSSWEIICDAFENQEVFKNSNLPSSLEHAFFYLSNQKYICLIGNSLKIDTDETNKDPKQILNRPTAMRLAILAWDAMVKTFEKFGTNGCTKSLSIEQQIIRSAITVVNVFTVNSDNKVQSGSVKKGVTFASEIYDCVTDRKTNTKFHSLKETTKIISLSKLLFGQGQDAITLLMPSDGTKKYQVEFFIRTFKPKCKCLIADSFDIAEHFSSSLNVDPKNFKSKEEDPKKFWNDLVALTPGSNDEEKNRRLIAVATAYAITTLNKNKLINMGIVKTKKNSVQPIDDEHAFNEIDELVRSENKNKLIVPEKNVLVNKIKFEDDSPYLALEEWKRKIYANPDRDIREKKVIEGLKKYLVVDLETTTYKKFKRVANPFCGDNWVVLTGSRDYRGRVFMNENYYIKEIAQNYDNEEIIKKYGICRDSEEPHSLFFPSLDDYDVLVGHNIKFDLLHMWRDPELRKFLKRGGAIWDTMYGEYLLSGQQVRYGRGANLEDVARSYGGRTPKLDEVKQAWATGKNTFEIPPDVLKEYLHGDLSNTELIFKKHLVRAYDQRQAIIIKARMDGLLCITEMEFNGLRINHETATQQADELNEKAILLEREATTLIPSLIGPNLRKQWNWASNQHLGYYFFGGDVSFSTYSYHSCRNLPRSEWGRHNLSDANHAPVDLGPPNIITAPAECTLLAGGSSTDRTSKVSKCYLLHYFSEGGFRKSAPWIDCVSRKFMTRSGRQDALINLIPGRYLLYTAAAEITDNTIKELIIKNIVTGEKSVFDFETPNAGDKFEAFLLRTAQEQTDPVHDPSNPSVRALAPTEVLLITRDAPISFSNALLSNNQLKLFLKKYHNNRPEYDFTDMPELTVSFVDANSALEYHRRNTELPLPPELVPEKRSPAPFVEDLMLPPSQWCDKYATLLEKCALTAFSEEKIEMKKLTKKQLEAIQKKDGEMPLLLRSLATQREELPLELTPGELLRFTILRFLGLITASQFDPFYVIGLPKEVTYQISSKLEEYVSHKGESLAIMERFRSTATNISKVGNETLVWFAEEHNDPAAKTIINLRAMQKLIGTYYESSEGGTGMVSLVHDTDQCIHHELVHIGTNTGRLSSSNPNCQNIPTEDKSPLRKMFVSRFPNGMCIEADYSQLEVVALAALSRDAEMIKDLHHKVDFHCKRVHMMRPDLSYEEIVQRAKKNKEPEYVKLRQQAKIFSFQRQYGAGVRTISESTGLNPEQVKALIEKERAVYSGCDLFTNVVTLSVNTFDASIQEAMRNAEGEFLHRGMFPVITGTRYIFLETDLPQAIRSNLRQGAKRTNFSPTILKNYPVQGFAAEIVQIILGRLWRHFKACNNYGGKALLTNTVHDCVWVDTSREVTMKVAEDVARIMGSAKDVLNELWPEMECNLDFPADVVVGPNLGSLRPLKELPSMLANTK